MKIKHIEFSLSTLALILPRYLLSRLHFLLPDRYFLITYYGGKIYLNLRESPMMMGRALGIYEYFKTRLISETVKEGMTIVDVGVNKGYYSLLGAKLMNDKGRVLSFEPDQDNCLWIRRSIEANRYRSIKLYRLALSDREGQALFYPGKRSGWGSLFFSPGTTAEQEKPLTVKTRRLDEILEEVGIDSVDIIKIDVEGAELLVLRGAENIIKKSKNVKLFIDIDTKSSLKEKKELFEFLSNCGFVIYGIDKKPKPIKNVKELNGIYKDIYAARVGN